MPGGAPCRSLPAVRHLEFALGFFLLEWPLSVEGRRTTPLQKRVRREAGPDEGVLGVLFSGRNPERLAASPAALPSAAAARSLPGFPRRETHLTDMEPLTVSAEARAPKPQP